MSIPAGDPQAGYIYPDKTAATPAGVLPPEEQQWRDDYGAAYDADVQAVTQAEADAAQQRADDAAQYASELHISSVTPSTAAGGDEITVSGQLFDGTTQVLLGGQVLETTLVSDTQVTALLPDPTTGGPYEISVFGCTDNLPFFVL